VSTPVPQDKAQDEPSDVASIDAAHYRGREPLA
jgi:hypothetical protein